MQFFYQGFSNTPAIYEIRNTVTKRRYVGQAKEPKNRWVRGHKQSLLNGRHYNRYLQNDFNKCFIEEGHTDFLEFHIIEPLPGATRALMNERECYWIKERAKEFALYNGVGGGSAHEVGRETRAKISEAKKRYYKTSEGKALIDKLASAKAGKTYEQLYGDDKAAEVRQKISENKLVEMNRPEVKENLSKLLKGKTDVERFGAEKAAIVAAKRSLKRKGKYTGKDSSRFVVIENVRLVSPDGTVYTKIEGIKEFALEHGLRPNHLCELLHHKRKTHAGWAVCTSENEQEQQHTKDPVAVAC